MEIFQKQLSPEASAKMDITGGKLILSALLDTKGVGAQVGVSVDVDYFIDQLAAKIPGTVDDAIFVVLKAAMNSL